MYEDAGPLGDDLAEPNRVHRNGVARRNQAFRKPLRRNAELGRETRQLDRTGRLLNRIGTPFFFQNVVGAMIATLVAVAAYYFAGQGPTALVATGIVMLLSGMTLV